MHSVKFLSCGRPTATGKSRASIQHQSLFRAATMVCHATMAAVRRHPPRTGTCVYISVQCLCPCSYEYMRWFMHMYMYTMQEWLRQRVRAHARQTRRSTDTGSTTLQFSSSPSASSISCCPACGRPARSLPRAWTDGGFGRVYYLLPRHLKHWKVKY